MKNIIVVTGGAGYVGSNLIKYIIKNEKNIKIISLDNYSSGSKKNHIKFKNIKYLEGETSQIHKILNYYKNKISVIFHFGEFSRIHQSFKDIDKCLEYNVNGTNNVIRFCLKNKIKLIYSATSASLGNKGYDQNLSPYAFTKSKNLKLINHLKNKFNFKNEILYFYNVYGKNHIRNGKMATVIGIFESQFLRGSKLTVTKPGTQRRIFTHIDDTVRGCFIAWKKNENKHYALSGNKEFSIKQIAKFFNSKIQYVEKRLGERKKSTKPKKIGNIRIYQIKCNKSIKHYIKNFINKNN